MIVRLSFRLFLDYFLAGDFVVIARLSFRLFMDYFLAISITFGLFLVIRHPPARVTSRDGQYDLCVRERVNLTPIPGRPAGQR